MDQEEQQASDYQADKDVASEEPIIKEDRDNDDIARAMTHEPNLNQTNED